LEPITGNNGALQGGAAYSGGQQGQGFIFNGTTAYVSVQHHTSLDPTGSFTVDAWIKTTITPGANQWILQKYECSQTCPLTATALYQMAVSATGKLVGSVREANAASGVAGQTLIGNRDVADGQFHHVAFVRDVTALQMQLYVDGQLDAQVALSSDADGPLVDGDGEGDPLIIGAATEGGTSTRNSFFAGTIDEIELYMRALSALEINNIFSSGGRRDFVSTFIPPPSEYSTLKRNADGSYVRTLKDGTTYQFNAQGYLTSMTDRNGNQTTYGYNVSNQLTTITDPASQVTTLAYSGPRLATITDPAGRVTTLTHDSAGNLIAVDAADQTRVAFNYDAQHRMVQRRDARGHIYTYQFDSAGRLKKAILPNGDSREIRPTEIVGVPDFPAGEGVPGNPAQLSQPPVIQATFKDANGHTTTFETDSIGRITKQIDPLTRTTTIQRDTQGNPLTITRPNGAMTTMTYDLKGNLLSSTQALTTTPLLTATTTFTYEPTFNQVATIKDPLNHMTTIAYDVKGNPETVTDADNKITRFFYNTRGLLTEMRDALYPANPATTFTYDTLGRLLTTTDPLNWTTTLTYDNAGNVATSKDHLNRITSFEYDAKNRLKKFIDPLLSETNYTYDGNGNLVTVKDAKNQITAFAYDSRNRLQSTTDPLGKSETYEYDGNDNLTKRITPKLDQIMFAYNAVNELLSKTLPGNLVTGYTYDSVGNLLTVTDPDSALTMTYDQGNRLLTTSTAGSSNQPNVTLTYTYDKAGNRLTLNGGTASNTYVYDVLNRLSTLTGAGGTSTFGYDALSRRTSLTLPNGTSTTYTYDVASQVTNILHKITATSAQINKADYVHNGVGNRESLTDRRGTQAFGYDTLDRLTSASHPLLGSPQSFTYDAVGNRTTAGNVVNAGNQLTADATHSYQYDDNGNLTRKTLVATGNYTQYTYDAENRLTQIEDFVLGNLTPAFTSTYRYDGLGRRIEKVANGQTKRYIYDGEDILLEYDGTNVLQARYTHGPGIDEPIVVTKGSSTYFYHQDGLGSVTDLTDSTGATAKSYAYDAYGNILESPGTVDQPYAYTGREFDTESGLYYYRSRSYDPTTGRFLRKDPLRFINGTNLYAYTMNNPTNYGDPLGLWRNPWAIYNDAQKRAQNSPFPDPHNGLQDAYRHCLASCMLTRENSSFEASILGWANEKKGDWFHNQEEGERQADDANNKCGREFGQAAKSTQDCEQSCGNAARNGTLQTYQQGTTPKYWGYPMSYLP
jgi:RHS repeat-associated protein